MSGGKRKPAKRSAKAFTPDTEALRHFNADCANAANAANRFNAAATNDAMMNNRFNPQPGDLSHLHSLFPELFPSPRKLTRRERFKVWWNSPATDTQFVLTMLASVALGMLIALGLHLMVPA